jgi:hypothetical protein
MTESWQKALNRLESATVCLEAALPDNMALAEEALSIRQEAVTSIKTLPPEFGAAESLRRLWIRGEESLRQCRLLRAEIAVELGNVEQQRLLMRSLGGGETEDTKIDCSI